MTTPLWKRIIARILEALLAIIFISPLVWVIICSFSPQAGSAQSKGWGVANYLTLFGYQEGLPKYLFNSVIVTLVAVVFSVVVCTLAGYSFSRFDYPGRNLGFMVTLSILMVPYASLLIPLMVWYKQIGLNDSLLGVGLVITLFQLHLAQKWGVVPSLLFAFVLTGWISMAALTRKQFYRFKGQEFVMAARTLGASDFRLMFKHIFPNAIGTIITSCALVIPSVIRSETTISYLGIVDLSAFAGTTIGTLLSQGNSAVTSAPHTLLWPSIFLSLLMISFNLFGNGLRDAFNPTTRGEDD